MVGRGAGKDGVIAVSSAALISPYNPVPHYNVDICANNEEQAVTPVKDIVEALENPKWEAKLSKYYYHTKEILRGRKNLGEVKGRTNNPKGRDGMRSGAVIFNEVHQYQNYDNIKVFVTGQGKVAEPRVGFLRPTVTSATARWTTILPVAAASCSRVKRMRASCRSFAV